MGDSHLIPPIKSKFLKWLTLADNLPSIIFLIRIYLIIIKSNRNPSILLNLHINLTILLPEPDIDPAAFIIFNGSFNRMRRNSSGAK